MGTVLFLSLVSIIGVFMSFAFKGVFHKLIAIGLALSILSAFVPFQEVAAARFWMLTAMSLATVIYRLAMNDFTKMEKGFIVSLGALFFIYQLAGFLGWGARPVILLIMLVPLFLFCLIVLRHRENLNRWISFMVIWIAVALSDLVGLILG